MNMAEIGVIYLCRGKDIDYYRAAETFLKSYVENSSGINHDLYVVLKGFESSAERISAEKLFQSKVKNFLYYDDDGYDIMAYIRAAKDINNDYVFFLNGFSKILHDNWLKYFYQNLKQPDIYLVGATGSYESIDSLYGFPSFPNPHIRSNAFMMERVFFNNVTNGIEIKTKFDAYHFESGKESLTRLTLKFGNVLVVGANGRGYEPKFWPMSGTFKTGIQENLLISDNQTKIYIKSSWPHKDYLSLKTWRLKKKLLRIQ